MRKCRVHLRRAIVAVLVGAAATVLTAWIAMFVPTGNAWYGPSTQEDLGLVCAETGDRLFQLSRGDNAWHRVVSYWHMQISGASLMIPAADFEARKMDLGTLPGHFRPDAVDNLNMHAWYHETGFPLAALTCSVHWKTQIRNSDIIYTVRDGVQLARDTDFNPRALPLRPLWPGFAANVVIWSCAWLLLAWGARTARGRIRNKRRRCPECGYSRRGLREGARCPECGLAPA